MAFRVGEGVIDLTVGTVGLARTMSGVSQRITGIGDAARAVSKVLQGLGLIAGRVALRAIQSFATFEQEMVRVGAITQAVGGEFGRLEKTARELGRTTVFTATQSAEAMAFLAKAGFEVNEIIEALPNTLALAAVGQLDMATAANITAKIMRGMGIDADELEEAVNVLARAFTSANTDLLQLGEAMKFVGPVARSAGFSLDETVAALLALADAGLQASIGGTALKRVITTLQSARAAKEFGKLGVAVRETGNDLRKLPELIGDLKIAMADLNPIAQAELIGLFGQRAGPAMRVFLNQGERGLRSYQKELTNTGITASDLAKEMKNTIIGKFTEMTSAIEGLAISLGSRYKTLVDDTTTSLRDLATEAEKTGDAFLWVDVVAVGLANIVNLLNIVVQTFRVIGGGVLTAGAAVATAITSPAFAIGKGLEAVGAEEAGRRLQAPTVGLGLFTQALAETTAQAAQSYAKSANQITVDFVKTQTMQAEATNRQTAQLTKIGDKLDRLVEAAQNPRPAVAGR